MVENNLQEEEYFVIKIIHLNKILIIILNTSLSPPSFIPENSLISKIIISPRIIQIIIKRFHSVPYM